MFSFCSFSQIFWHRQNQFDKHQNVCTLGTWRINFADKTQDNSGFSLCRKFLIRFASMVSNNLKTRNISLLTWYCHLLRDYQNSWKLFWQPKVWKRRSFYCEIFPSTKNWYFQLSSSGQKYLPFRFVSWVKSYQGQFWFNSFIGVAI